MAGRVATRLRDWLGSGWFDPALAAVFALAAAIEWLVHGLYDSHSPLVVVTTACACGALALRRRHVVAATLVVAPLLLLQGLAGDLDEDPVSLIVAIGLLSYAVGAFADRAPAVLAGSVLLGCLVVAGDVVDHDIVPYLYFAAPWICGFVVRSRREVVGELEQRSHELEAEQDAFARLAVRHERARIARELHDVVAHNIAVMVVQAGAGRMATNGQAAAAAERFASIHASGRETLEEMSRLVDVLHPGDDPEPAAGVSRLDQLLSQAQGAGLRISATALPTGVPFSRELEETLYRVVQEGLTNALKHAPGAAVALAFDVEGDQLGIQIEDGGGGADPRLSSTGAGLGLTGMRERVAACGGRLDAGPTAAGGWRLSARLPLSAG